MMSQLIINKSKPCEPSNYTKGRKDPVKYLVVHYVGATGSARNNAHYYGSTPNIGASAHYFVGHAAEGAEIWQSVAEGDTAWHCGDKRYRHPECRNANAIGVELCCHKDSSGKWYFDPETVDAAVALCRDIAERYGLDRVHVLRHYDVTGKVCPAPFVHDEGAWEDFLDRVFAATTPSADDADSWAARAWDKAKATGVLDGTRPRDSVTRQELAVVLDRLGFLK